MSTGGEGVDVIANDKQLIASFEGLVHTYKDPLYCILLRMTGQQELAVLMLKEVFVKIYDELPYYDGTIYMKSWVYRIAITYWQEQKECRKI